MKLVSNGKEYELRGGAWLDEMNSCSYEVKHSLGSGYVLCEEVGTRKEFALYMPNYFGDFEENPYLTD